MLSLLLLMIMTTGPKLQVNPHFANAPATVRLLLTDIPAGSGVVCFALDGTNFYGGCQYVEGRRSILVEYKDARAGEYTAWATIDEKVVSKQPVTIMGIMEAPMEDFDGRDAMVKGVYGKQSLVAKVPSADDQVRMYANPWMKTWWCQFEDLLPKRIGAYDSCIEGIHGMKSWTIPVTEATKVSGGYEQRNLGFMEITEVPDYETGEVEWVISIAEAL